MHPKTKRNPRGAGRTPLPRAEKKIKCSIAIHPDIWEYLWVTGDGNVSKGVELSIRKLAGEEQPKNI